jgi:hypothetical protein
VRPEGLGRLDVGGEIFEGGLALVDGRDRGVFVRAPFAFSSSPTAPAPAASFGSGTASRTNFAQGARLVLIRRVGNSGDGLAFEEGIQVALRPFRAWGEEICAERRIAGTCPRAARDVAWFPRPVVWLQSFSLALAGRLRRPRGASSLSVGRRWSPPLCLDFVREGLLARRTIRAEVLAGRDLAWPFPLSPSRADRRTPPPASGWLVKGRDVLEFGLRAQLVGTGAAFELRNQ